MTNEKFTIHYKQHRIAEDISGASCLMVYYDYSNNGTSNSSAMVDVSLQAFQNGQALSAAIPSADDEAINQFMAEVTPGQDSYRMPGIYTERSVGRNTPGRRGFQFRRRNCYFSDPEGTVIPVKLKST